MTDTVRVPKEPNPALLPVIASIVRRLAIPTNIDPDEVYFDNGHARQIYAAIVAASPQGEGSSADTPMEAVALPAISHDGPHKPGEHRVWLARQLLDSRLTEDEAYSTVAHSPAISDFHPAPTKPSADTGELPVHR